MNEIALKDFLVGRSQKEVADLIGVTPGAVWQMLRDARDIRIRQVGPCCFEAVEVKPIGRARVKAA
jgi:hypothetical protein